MNQVKAHPPASNTTEFAGSEKRMSKTKDVASRGSQRLSYEEFFARHQSEQSALDFLALRVDPGGESTSMARALVVPDLWPPLPPLMRELKDHPFLRWLGAAARENCPDAYNAYLYLWLCRMGITPPEGVFLKPRGKPGRPNDPRTSLIHDKWIEIGEPPLGRQKLAHAVYGKEFTKAGSRQRKTMVDRCRRAVQRRQDQLRAALK
jgi:hypothetical protein